MGADPALALRAKPAKSGLVAPRIDPGEGARHRCWAINIGERRYLGILYWFDGNVPILPRHVQGNRTATWATRQDARQALKNLKSRPFVAYPKARVCRVTITIWEA